MSELLDVLRQGLGANLVHSYPKKEGDKIDLLKIDLQINYPVSILMTDGLSNLKMTIPEIYQNRIEYKNRFHIELFFCLPDYWDLRAIEDPNIQWPLDVLQKLATGLIEHNAWYGAGHTISNGNPARPISEKMQEKYFMLMDPILLKDYLPPIQFGGKDVYFLAIVPVFEKEFSKKNKKGYTKWLKFYINRQGNEVLDDFRRSTHKRYWERY